MTGLIDLCGEGATLFNKQNQGEGRSGVELIAVWARISFQLLLTCPGKD